MRITELLDKQKHQDRRCSKIQERASRPDGRTDGKEWKNQ